MEELAPTALAGLRPARATAAVAFTMAAFAVALAAHRQPWFWLATAASAALAAALAAWAAAPRLRALLRPRAASAAIGVTTGLALAAATHVLFAHAASAYAPLAPAVRDLYATLAGYPGRATTVLVVSLAVLAEELVWRGLLVDLLRRHGPRRTLALGTLLYALPLLAAGNPALMVAALGCGAVWTALRLACDDLVAPLASHLVWNALLLALWRLGAPV
jgi:membrane protease YdiL (CAAX protease family)